MGQPRVPTLGHALIDRQHQRISSAVAAFLTASRAGPARRELTLLMQATRRNFASEERLMRTGRYPRRAGHLALHRGILSEMDLLRATLRRRALPHHRLVAKAVDWLAHHADEADRRLVEFLFRNSASVTRPRL